MAKTILIFAYFWFFLIFSAAFVPVILVLSLPGLGRLRKVFLGFFVPLWANQFLWLTGARVLVQGRGNIPRQNKVCFIGNHQSVFDILLILAHSGKIPGFIAKKELLYAPFLNFWMLAIHCVFIERRNPRKSIMSIERGVASLKKGYPMAIFPEGTRSRAGVVGDFKAGSFKLATKAGAIIVPVSMVDTYTLYEKEGRFRAGDVKVVFHTPIPTDSLTAEEKKALPERVRRIILRGFTGTEEDSPEVGSAGTEEG